MLKNSLFIKPMRLNWTLSVVLLLCNWTVSSGQSSADTICYTTEQARVIAYKLTEGEQCAELLRVSVIEANALQGQVDRYVSIEQSLNAEIVIKDQVINLRIDDAKGLTEEVKYWKKRSRTTLLISAVVVGVVAILAIK